MLKIAILLISISPPWPHEWLETGQEGFFSATVTLNSKCELNLSNLESKPKNLSYVLAKSLVENYILNDQKLTDMDEIKSWHPETDFNSVLSFEKGQEVLKTIEKLGPWKLKRTVRIGKTIVVCVFSELHELEDVQEGSLPYQQKMEFEFKFE